MRVRKSILAILISVACLSITLSVVRVAATNPAPAVPVLDLNVPPEIPLHIVNFRFDPSPGGMLAFHYDVQNASGQGLVALEVRWQAYSGDTATNDVANRDDRWLSGMVPVGGSARFQVTNVPSSAAQPVNRLTGTIAYAEFEDGTRVGTKVARVGRQITRGRKTTVAAYQKLLDTFNTDGPDALVQALKQQNATSGQDAATQAATAHLVGLLADQGVDAVVLELRRVSDMSIPEAHP